MGRHRVVETHEPLTDAELAEAEKRANSLPRAWPREAMLRLIAEVRRARAARSPTPDRPGAALEVEAPLAEPDYTPPGGRVTMAEWQAIAARLQADRGPVSEPYQPSPAELAERQRRWEELRAQLGWDTPAPLTPEQEKELDNLIQEEIKAHRQEKQYERERHARGR